MQLSAFQLLNVGFSDSSAASRLRVRAGGVGDAAVDVASQPLLWAGIAALGLSASGRGLPLMVRPFCRHCCVL